MRIIVLSLSVALSALAVLAVPAWAQEPEPPADDGAAADFVVEPASDASTSPRGGWFVLDVEPGGEMRQELEVRNRGDEPVELALAAVDADTGPTGGASYRRLDAPVEATGGWIDLDREQMRLEADETETVSFTVAVPDGADSGDHLAGVAVWAPDEAEEVEELEEGSGAVVTVEQRRVVAVHAILPGPDEPLLRIDGVEPQAHAGGVRLRVGIANEGRGLTSGEGTLEVVDPTFEQSFEIGTFVPDTAIAYPMAWVDDQPGEGTYHARVEIDYGTQTATWEGTFTIGEDISRELEQFDVEGDDGDRGPNPWWWVAAGAAGALVVALIAWGLHRLARRRARRDR